MSLQISCAFATSSDNGAVEIAEELGYERDVPILIGAGGPKGLAVAAELGDGVFSAALPQPDAANVTNRRAVLSFGTVLDEGEDLTSPRVIDTARQRRWCSTTPRRNAAARPRSMPYWAGGLGVRRSKAFPEGERHLAKANPRDEPHIADLIPFASSVALTGTAERVPEIFAGLAALGVTELVYQPAGSDI